MRAPITYFQALLTSGWCAGPTFSRRGRSKRFPRLPKQYERAHRQLRLRSTRLLALRVAGSPRRQDQLEQQEQAGRPSSSLAQEARRFQNKGLGPAWLPEPEERKKKWSSSSKRGHDGLRRPGDCFLAEQSCYLVLGVFLFWPHFPLPLSALSFWRLKDAVDGHEGQNTKLASSYEGFPFTIVILL